MLRILKKIYLYRQRIGFTRLAKILFLILIAKILARRFIRFSANWRIQKLVLPRIKHPVYVRPGTTDIEVLQQVLLDHEYEFNLSASPKIIIDAGANIGLASVYFANTYPDATIIALEPDRSNFKLIEMNTAGYPQIKAMNVALWSENKKINLFYPQAGHSGFRTLEENSGLLQECGEVSAVTVDALMMAHQLDVIDLLKMDIEGAEKEVFQNCSTWIDKVKTLMVELHDTTQPGCGEAFYEATKNFQPQIVMKGETLLRLREVASSN